MDKRYWKLAWEYSKCSTDTNTKIGSVLVRNGEFIDFGWNREITYIPGKRGFVHAEMDAIVGNDCEGAILYCTWACCTDCAKAIYLAGITKVVTSWIDYPKWNQEIAWGHEILRDNDVEIEFVKPYGTLLIGGELR